MISNKVEYRLVEIEFYFNCEQHRDSSTHEHNLDAWQWRFHNSGLDITLWESDNREGYGGILIRSIKSLDGNFTNGPRKVVSQLFRDQGTVSEVNNGIRLVEKSFDDLYSLHDEENRILSTWRHNIGKSEFADSTYRYIIDRTLNNKVKGREQVCRKYLMDHPERSDEVKQWLGYNLKLKSNI
ncbi:hypothetical protein [Fulvivirga ligni]|uniref:hypothetical protein n=1 Tax=Fulvivirga ligni TaxID=2904246 RepID=UPI001F169931|nr:hypothetical protein [Fulvivirga ligni]UII19649.1 hypothetical protein LVD16_17555 [Fulvivirga ligni]